MATRDEIQAHALRSLAENRRVILEWGTGVGKSRVGVLAADGTLRGFGECARVLLLVAETTHKDNWRKEFEQCLGPERSEELLSHVTIECYNSLKNHRDTAWNLIIADEAHHLRSDLRQDVLSSLHSDRFLALSATLDDNGDGEALMRTLEEAFGHFRTLRYGINEAIEDGILPEPIIELIKIQLDETAQERYDKMNANIESKKSEYIEAHRQLGLPYTEEVPSTQDLKDSWMYSCNRRKQFLGAQKNGMARWLIRKLEKEDKRFICFCSSIKQAERLGGYNLLNSNKSQKENAETIRRFNDHEINSLYVVGMLQEGQNLRDIDAGIIVQLNSKERSFSQRFGRVMRSRHPYLYIIYVPGTRDEEYLDNALADTRDEFIHGRDWKRKDKSEKTEAPHLRDISYTQLVAPRWSGSETFPIRRWTASGGAFFNGREYATAIGGIFSCITTDGQNIEVNIWNPSGVMETVTLRWTQSFGLLSELRALGSPYGTNVFLCAKANGQWTDLTLMNASGTAVPVNLSGLPPKGTPEHDERLNYVNCMIEEINQSQRKVS